MRSERSPCRCSLRSAASFVDCSVAERSHRACVHSGETLPFDAPRRGGQLRWTSARLRSQRSLRYDSQSTSREQRRLNPLTTALAAKRKTLLPELEATYKDLHQH